jgi:hypothetical protein
LILFIVYEIYGTLLSDQYNYWLHLKMGISSEPRGPEQGKKLKNYRQTGRKIQGRSLKRLLDV